MVEGAKSWLRENCNLLYFLDRSSRSLSAGGAFSLTYLHGEFRSTGGDTGSAGQPPPSGDKHEADDAGEVNRAKQTSIDRIVDVMTKKLSINPH